MFCMNNISNVIKKKLDDHLWNIVLSQTSNDVSHLTYGTLGWYIHNEIPYRTIETEINNSLNQ